MFWKATRAEVIARDGPYCHYCGARVYLRPSDPYGRKPDALTIDHVIPLSRGGEDEVDNMVVACGTCNNLKRSTSRKDFVAWLNRCGPRTFGVVQKMEKELERKGREWA